jgi:glycosyltransferase involved in cell wall biosynthesis/2-polyprenyl-3-methyl-5-hydroxy-6-metoxy-1,4-benzoquinol methylase|tara:strand:+ start:4085 stop:7006 length:2922 start_codon:yes stop_codon:yes gene_type:complete
MEKHKLDIIFLVAGMEIYPGILKEKSLGGSETTGLAMAYGLAKKGHNVKLFCNTKEPGEEDGVTFLPAGTDPGGIQNYLSYVTNCPVDVNVVQRIPQAFSFQNKAKLNILWQHDFATIRQRKDFNSCLWNVDEVFVLSDWQKNQYKDIYEMLDDQMGDTPTYNYDLFWQTSNGIDVIEDLKITRKKKQLVYTNRPERGMDILLHDIAPKIWAKDKDVEILICGYDNTTSDMLPFYESLWTKIKQYQDQGFKIGHLGALTKQNLYKLYQESTAFIYPTEFYETSCITAMESQECGLPMITSNLGALPETLCNESNFIIDGNAKTQQYQDAFVKAVFEVINEDDNKAKQRRTKLKQKSQQYYWHKVVDKWEEHFLDLFKKKQVNQESLLQHLYRKEDIMTLKHILKNNNEDYAKPFKKEMEDFYQYTDNPEQYKQKYVDLGKEYIQNETKFQPKMYPRTEACLKLLANFHEKKPIKTVLDFGSGIGNEAFFINQTIQAQVDCVNISEEENVGANKLLATSDQDLSKSIKFITGDEDNFAPSNKYDMLHLGEVLEHQPCPKTFLDKLHKHLKHEAKVIVTVPIGMWQDVRHAHLWNFERQDLEEIFGKQKEFSVQCVSGPQNIQQSDNLGWWIISYTKTNAPLGFVNLNRKAAIQAPRETVTICMIAKNEEDMLGRCLKSVRPIADKIIVADNQSTDRTREICKQYGAEIREGIDPKEVGFDTARNNSITGVTTDWIFWIDADEEFNDNWKILKYLRRNCFNGYSVKQVHFTSDPPMQPKVDMPIRLFRNNKDIKFYGFVHEHPETVIGKGVGASMICSDLFLGHDGYLTESVRRMRFERNIPLMFKDREKYPDRLLGKFLMLRDYVHLARYDVEKNNKQLTEKSIQYCQRAIELFKSDFADDTNLYVDEALQFVSEAMAILNIGYEFSTSLIWKDQLGESHNIDIAGRFENYEAFVKFQAAKLKDLEKSYTGKFL